jgi:protein-tyrosine phosphatase
MLKFYFINDMCEHFYYRADEIGDTEDSVVQYFKPLLEFVGEAVDTGQNVLIHCLAGAHRAGTVGIICLMHYTDM